MPKTVLFIIISLLSAGAFSRDNQTDSLIAALNTAKADTAKVDILNMISKAYMNSSSANAIKYSMEARDLAEKIDYKRGKASALKNIGIGYYMQSDYVEALSYWSQSLEVFRQIEDKAGVANILSNIGSVYFNEGDDARALEYYLQSLQYAEETGDTLRIATALINIGAVYFNKPATHDKALSYYLKALPLSERLNDNDAIGTTTVNLGEIYLAKGDDSSALNYFERSLKAYENSKNIPYSLNSIGKVYEKRGDYTAAIKYHQQALDISTKLSARIDMAQSLLGLAGSWSGKGAISSALSAYSQAQAIAEEIGADYELKNVYEGLALTYASVSDYSNAYKYQKLLTEIKDTLYNTVTDKKLQLLQFNFEIQKKQGEIDRLTNDKILQKSELQRQTIVKNALIAVLLMISVIVFILFRNYRIKVKTNSKLDLQKDELERTLKELRTTQSQLVQSEKMASLGELTAGIAHEIQNPLNFINNFSEVSMELAAELKDELRISSLTDSEKSDLELLINDIVDNQGIINNHGRRAGEIVKSMLQHSRTNAGKKEPVNINALTDEYLRLSFHGLKAKDKSFDATLQTDFDENIGEINIMQQDIGRVILNLITNAFYAVSEKKKNNIEGYKPVVKVSTKKVLNNVEIRIMDNGMGIPQKLLDKIFQPFFTTKPAGKGTGLGLSLSYDIITKGHGGELKVETKEGEFAEFIIRIPL